VRRLSETEVRAFLTHGTRTGKLAIVRRDGSPMVVPIWFDVDDDGSLLFTTWHETIKGRALRRDPRVSICVDSEEPPYAYVRVDGVAEVSEDPAELRAWATRIGGRYMGADRAESFGARNGVPGELLVRVRPTRTVAQADIAD
jgi:PPOX class probable F420-dependent enzyme